MSELHEEPDFDVIGRTGTEYAGTITVEHIGSGQSTTVAWDYAGDDCMDVEEAYDWAVDVVRTRLQRLTITRREYLEAMV